jgi:hypothetical protein
MTSPVHRSGAITPPLNPVEEGMSGPSATPSPVSPSGTRKKGVLGDLPARSDALSKPAAASSDKEFISKASIDGPIRQGRNSHEIANELNASGAEAQRIIQWGLVNGASAPTGTMYRMPMRSTPTPAHEALYRVNGDVTAVAKEFGITEPGPLEQLQWYSVNGPLMKKMMRGQCSDVEALAGDSGITAAGPLQHLRMMATIKSAQKPPQDHGK